jgi:hypothetical protein
MEPPILIYKIELEDLGRRARVAGYRCAAAVSVKPVGGRVVWHRDSSCLLDKEIQRVVARAAVGTRKATVGCK